jgi:hypothetical protein
MKDATPDSWTVLGRTISAPVEVRRAAQWGAQFLVDLTAAQKLVAPTGLEATGPLPGKALVALAVCRYDDTDLDRYHEVALSFVVRRHDADKTAGFTQRLREFSTGAIGAYIHRLPVDQEFTCAAGRDIWGFPKWLTEITIDGEAGQTTVVRLVDDGAPVLTLTFKPGWGLRLPEKVPPSYSFRDSVLRLTPWTMQTEGSSGRPGGVSLVLGSHPMADELRSLGLPKAAIFSSSARQMSASFSPAEIVTPRQV